MSTTEITITKLDPSYGKRNKLLCLIDIKALNREVEPYGFHLVKPLGKIHYALGRGLLPIG